MSCICCGCSLLPWSVLHLVTSYTSIERACIKSIYSLSGSTINELSETWAELVMDISKVAYFSHQS